MSHTHRVETKSLPWAKGPDPGVEHKMLGPRGPQTGEATSLVRLAPGAKLPAPPPGFGSEIIILEGELILAGDLLPAMSYARQPGTLPQQAFTEGGCTLFLKQGPFAAEDTAAVRLKDSATAWLPGQGNLRVKPLHEFGTEGTALVHWPAGERFRPHRHWGGEEILVLSGTFMDEHGRYPTGTWMQSPHMSAHHPFVMEETVIFVKTGHLQPEAAAMSVEASR